MNISGGRIQLLALVLQMCEREASVPVAELHFKISGRSEVYKESLIKEAVHLGLNSGLIRELESSKIELTHLGRSAIKTDGKDVFEAERRILARLITTVRRDLLKIGFMDSDELSELGRNEQECLEQFGLLDYQLSPGAKKWWEGLRSAGAQFDSAILKEVGDQAELASINFEEVRLQRLGLIGKSVDWVSRETDLAGYDILSYVGDALRVNERLCIEVKKLSSSSAGGLYFFLSRNEAEVARKSTNYVFHLWQAYGEVETWSVAVIPSDKVLEKLPADSVFSSWETCKVTISNAELETYRVRS